MHYTLSINDDIFITTYSNQQSQLFQILEASYVDDNVSSIILLSIWLVTTLIKLLSTAVEMRMQLFTLEVTSRKVLKNLLITFY